MIIAIYTCIILFIIFVFLPSLSKICSKIRKKEVSLFWAKDDIYTLAKELKNSKILILLSMPVLIVITPMFLLGVPLLFLLLPALFFSLPNYIVDTIKMIFIISAISFILLWAQISWRLAKGFGKKNWYAVLLFFLAPIFIPILAFDDSKYLKNSK